MTSLGLLLQSIGSVLLVGGSLFQISRLLKRKDATGVSVPFWYMIFIGCLLTFTNMFIQGTTVAVVVTQAFNVTLAIITFVLTCKYTPNAIRDNIAIPYSFIILVLVLIFAWLHIGDIKEFGNLIQIIGTISLLTSYIPSIVHLVRVKNSNGVSILLFIVLGIGMIFIIMNMIISKTNILIIVQESVNVILITIQAYLVKKYRVKDAVDINKTIAI